jgi:competence protein ComEC
MVRGENVTVVIAVTLALARAVGLRRRGRAVLCALALVGFVVLARPSPSVLRAAVMGSIALLALLVGRKASALPSLSTAVIALVVIDPFLARAVGFVLSVSATAGIVLLAPGWTDRLARRMPRPLAVAVAVPAAAQVACTPVLILAFGQLTPYAIPANLIAAPAVVPATVVGVVAAIVATLSVPAAAPLAMLGAAPTAVIAIVARELAALPGADLRWTRPTALGLLAAAALLLAIRRRRAVSRS